MVNETHIWKTIQEYVDHETGEILTRTKAKKNYIIQFKQKSYENRNGFNYVKWTYICTKCRQYKLF